jgi:hypothetical protein
VVITVRKVLAQLQRQGARKRGGGRLLGESALIGVAAAEGGPMIPIGKSEPLSIVRGGPPDLSSILVSPSEALFSSRFVLCLGPLESHAGRDLLPRSD